VRKAVLRTGGVCLPLGNDGPRGQWPDRLGHRSLDEKCAGARSAGNPHAACDVAGAGNGDMVRTEAPALGESSRQRLLPYLLYRASPRPYHAEPALESRPISVLALGWPSSAPGVLGH
jgi:hypothetical protein